jgi:hypothetical protein
MRGRGGGQEFMGRLIAEVPAVLSLMCAQADLNRCPRCKVPWAVDSQLRGYNDVYGGLKAARLGVGREIGDPSTFWPGVCRGPQGPLELFSFLSQTP